MNEKKVPEWRRTSAALRDALFAEMRACGVSTTLAANWLGLSSVAIYRWSTGVGKLSPTPTPDMFERIAAFTGVMTRARSAGALPLDGVAFAPVKRGGRAEVMATLLQAKAELEAE